MSVHEETLLWKYIDGECTPEELEAVNKMLTDDPHLQEKLRIMRKLHLNLGNMDLEQPSLRFTQNIMERVPVLWSNTRIEPLLKPQWIYLFVGLLITSGILLFFWTPANTGEQGALAQNLSSLLHQWTEWLLSAGISIPALLLFGLALLFILDHWFGRQLQGENR